MATKNKPLPKNPFAALPKPVKLPTVRVPRGPTIRWDIDYERLFRNRRKK